MAKVDEMFYYYLTYKELKLFLLYYITFFCVAIILPIRN